MTRVDLADVNLNLLVALDALVHERSVTGAARRAHVTPSAMRRRVRRAVRAGGRRGDEVARS
jgi:DNA-binding transcriptional LysR family regulator